MKKLILFVVICLMSMSTITTYAAQTDKSVLHADNATTTSDNIIIEDTELSLAVKEGFENERFMYSKKLKQVLTEPVIEEGSLSDYQKYALSLFSEYDWDDSEFEPLVVLWTRESQWTTTALNPSSGAYGIPQSLPAEKMAAFGDDWKTNYKTQIQWGLWYISTRYGSPTAALAHSDATSWY